MKEHALRLADQDEFRLVIEATDEPLHQAAGGVLRWNVDKIAGSNQTCEFPYNFTTMERVEVSKGRFKMLPVHRVIMGTVTTKQDEVVVCIERSPLVETLRPLFQRQTSKK